jgi:hypothetical protein
MPSSHYYSGGAGSVSLAAMFSAFSLLFLYLASLLPGLQIIMYFLSSIFVMGIMLEESYGLAILSAMVVSILGLLVLPDKTLLLPYVFFFGHYGIAKYLIEKKNRRAAAMVLKYIYFYAAFAALYFTAQSLLFAQIPFELPLAAFIVILEILFLVYDFLFTKVTLYYNERIRRKLKGSYF